MNNAKAIIPFGFLLALGLVISTYLVTDVHPLINEEINSCK